MGKKWGQLPRGVTVREGRTKDTIQVAFTYKGVRCREPLSIPVTRANLKYAGNLLGEIQNEIERQTFNYADYFPESKKLEIFGRRVKRDRTVDDYLEEYQQSAIRRGLSPSTIEGYRKLKLAVKPLHAIPVVDLTPARLKEYIRTSGNSAKTLRNKFSYLRSALAEAVTDELVQINPIDGVKLSNYVEKQNKVNLEEEHDDVDPFTPQEATKIKKACKPDELNIVTLVINTGLRSSEWSALRWKDVDLEHEEINIRVAIVHGELKGPKSKAGKRTIPLNKAAIGALVDQKAQYDNPDGFVFPKSVKRGYQMPNGELNRVNPDSFRKHRWSRIMKSAGVRYRYPYQMRHTYATKHISRGVNLWQLAKWMGHTSPEMLFRHYGKFIEDYQAKTKRNDTPVTREPKTEKEKP